MSAEAIYLFMLRPNNDDFAVVLWCSHPGVAELLKEANGGALVDKSDTEFPFPTEAGFWVWDGVVEGYAEGWGRGGGRFVEGRFRRPNATELALACAWRNPFDPASERQLMVDKVREVLLARNGQPLTEELADERARQIVQALCNGR